jgi:hypothetical protein
MHRKIFVVLLLLSLSLSFTQLAAQEGPLSVPTADHDAEILVKWMDLLYERVEAETISAPGASRLYAYAGVTAYQ